MSASSPSTGAAPRPDAHPTDIHSHAMENLRFIRETMESAGSFTAVSGAGQVVVGVTALAAAGVASLQRSQASWLTVWLVEAVVAGLVGAWGIRRKAKATGVSLISGPARKFVICFAPPLVAGALLTPVLYGAGAVASLPGAWLIFFGTAVVTGGALSVRIVPFMGLALMLLGAAALLAPPSLGNLFMALGFGVVLIVFGAIIARRHGG